MAGRVTKRKKAISPQACTCIMSQWRRRGQVPGDSARRRRGLQPPPTRKRDRGNGAARPARVVLHRHLEIPTRADRDAAHAQARCYSWWSPSRCAGLISRGEMGADIVVGEGQSMARASFGGALFRPVATRENSSGRCLAGSQARPSTGGKSVLPDPFDPRAAYTREIRPATSAPQRPVRVGFDPMSLRRKPAASRASESRASTRGRPAMSSIPRGGRQRQLLQRVHAKAAGRARPGFTNGRVGASGLSLGLLYPDSRASPPGGRGGGRNGDAMTSRIRSSAEGGGAMTVTHRLERALPERAGLSRDRDRQSARCSSNPVFELGRGDQPGSIWREARPIDRLGGLPEALRSPPGLRTRAVRHYTRLRGRIKRSTSAVPSGQAR